MTQGRFISVLLAILVCQPVSPSDAQLPSDESIFDSAPNQTDLPEKNISPELMEESINQLANSLGVSPTSRFYQGLRSAAQLTISQKQANIQFSDRDKKPDEPAKIIKHLRGRKGSPLPKVEEFAPKAPITEDQIRETVHQNLGDVQGILDKLQDIPDLPDCSENDSAKTESGIEEQNNNKTVVFDMVFVRSDELPVSAEGIFGKATAVRPYSRSEKLPSSYAASLLNVPCLPYRIRITPGWVIHDRGINALKNYDKNPFGKGVLDPVFKRKYGIRD